MKNNLEAVKEVVRQPRLRDIGGIIVIDFIDMANPKNRATVEEALRSELERDRTKTYVAISPLGLGEMTRQNVTDGPREILTSRCPIQEGRRPGRRDARAGDRAKASDPREGVPRAGVPRRRSPARTALDRGPGGTRLEAVEAAARRRFFLTPAENGHVHLDHFDVLGQGKLDALRPATSIKEGASIELKLVEVGLHDATAESGRSTTTRSWLRAVRSSSARRSALRRPGSREHGVRHPRRGPGSVLRDHVRGGGRTPDAGTEPKEGGRRGAEIETSSHADGALSRTRRRCRRRGPGSSRCRG